MRLRSVHAEGFGRLRDVRLELDAPAVLVYGPNEAGKSTVFSLIRSLLYGFASRSNPAERQEPLYGGRHGGRLAFEAPGKGIYMLERHAETGTRLSLRRLDGGAGLGAEAESNAVLDQQEWERGWLGGVTERMFRQLFAVTLTELQEVSVLRGEELGKFLYHAGLSGGKALAAAEKKLQQELESLFKPRGSNQSMNRLLKDTEQLDMRLRMLPDRIEHYNRLHDELAAAEKELKRIERRLPELEASAAVLAKAAAIRPLWLERLTLIRELSGLPSPDRLPADAGRRWEQWTDAKGLLEAEKTRLSLQLLHAEEERAAVRVRHELLAIEDDTELLMHSAETIAGRRSELTELDGELRAADAEIGRTLASISPEWSEAELTAFPVSVADREAVRSRRTAFAEAEREAARLREVERAAQEQAREAAAVLEAAGTGRIAAEDAGVAFVPQDRASLQQAWDALDAEFREWEFEQARAAGEAAAGGRISGGRLPPAAAAALAAAGAGGAALAAADAAGLRGASLAGAAAVTAALAALAVLAVLAVLAARPMRPGRAASRELRGSRRLSPAAADRLRGSELRVNAALYALLREPEAAAASAAWLPVPAAGWPVNPEPAAPAPLTQSAPAAATAQRFRRNAAGRGALRERTAPAAEAGGEAGAAAGEASLAAAAETRRQLRAAVQARLDLLGSAAMEAARRDELVRRLDRLNALSAQRRHEAEDAALHLSRLQSEWSRWLDSRALPQGLSPDAALEVLDLAEQGRRRLSDRAKLARRRTETLADIEAFEQAARTLCGADPAAAQLAARDAAAALRVLRAEIRRQADAKRQADRLDEKRKELMQALEETGLQLERLNETAAAWFHAAGAADEEEWRSLLSGATRAAGLTEAVRRLEAELYAGLEDTKRSRLDELLESRDGEELAAELEAASNGLAAAQRERSMLLEQRGRLRQALEQLLQSDERDELAAKREMNIAALEQQYDRYAMLSAAQTLVRRTKERLERERQPAVLRQASARIERLTRGAYTRIIAGPDTASILLETADGRLVDSAFLSRGTAEQTYLAMRLSLADAVAPGVTLPMLLDDLFVNFDRGRLAATAEELAGIAEDRQLVLTTCHDHIRSELERAIPGLKVIEL